MNSSITSFSPTPRNGKYGWHDQFQKHNLLLNKSKAKVLIVGDSLVSNLSHYPKIWRKYFSNDGPLNFGIAGDKAQNLLWRVNNPHFSSNLHLKYIFSFFVAPITLIAILLSLLLAPSFPLVWSFKRRVTNFKLLLYHFYRATINTQEDEELSTLLINCCKFQCLNNGFYSLEFKSDWLNKDDSLNMELFYNDYLHLIRKGSELLAKDIIDFFYHSKYMLAYSKPSYRNIISFSFNFAPLPSQDSTVNSFNSLQSSKLSSSSNFSTQKSFAKSVLNSNHSRFQ